MATKEEFEQMRDLADSFSKTPNPAIRICALCLSEVDRATYDQHMQSHGYETLILSDAK